MYGCTTARPHQTAGRHFGASWLPGPTPVPCIVSCAGGGSAPRQFWGLLPSGIRLSGTRMWAFRKRMSRLGCDPKTRRSWANPLNLWAKRGHVFIPVKFVLPIPPDRPETGWMPPRCAPWGCCTGDRPRGSNTPWRNASPPGASGEQRFEATVVICRVCVGVGRLARNGARRALEHNVATDVELAHRIRE